MNERPAFDPSDRMVDLPPPSRNKIDSLSKAIANRKTIREIGAKPLTPGQLSNLLQTAFGMNRGVGPFGAPGRTAASASNSQEIDLFVVLQSGSYRYDALNHRLELVARGDLRPLALNQRQRSISAAPVHLIFVADIRRFTNTIGFDEPGLHDPKSQRSYYFVDTGMIAQNVYLFAAANGLAAWFHHCDRAGIAAALSLGQQQKVLFAQTVGYPAA